jgi:ABC-type Fe3+/spermidine/putrescine transport system ATPase subunit
VVAQTALGLVRGRPVASAHLEPGARCVLVVRPENVAFGLGDENRFDARIVLASYLGNTLRYDVDAGPGVSMKVDVRDPWHHEPLAVGAAVTIAFPASAALALGDD